MNKLQVTPGILTGHPLVDREHEGLIILTNTCIDNLLEDDQVSCSRNLEKLGNLLSKHFDNEEAIMHELNYGNVHSHSNHHQQAFGKYEAVGQSCKLDCRNEECIIDVKFLLIDDLIAADMDFKSYLSEINYQHPN